MVRRVVMIVVALLLLSVGADLLCAYTYTYKNMTDVVVRIDVQLYDAANNVAEIAANQSHTISTRFLIKSWTIELFLDNQWQQALELTCDLLPGDHTFSIYVKENGEGKRDWYVIKQ